VYAFQSIIYVLTLFTIILLRGHLFHCNCAQGMCNKRNTKIQSLFNIIYHLYRFPSVFCNTDNIEKVT